MDSKAKEALSDYFGHDSFRPLQREAIEATLNNEDSLVLMPTGGGKSICFQIPAILQDGLCIVVSPLISLMRDQVDKLTDRKIAAAYLNSSLNKQEQQEVKKQMAADNLDLVYLSPERLSRSYFQNFLQNSVNVNLFAIDEAHCISSWGHDFRPEYTNLKVLKQKFPTTPVLALTATADETTRRDIIRQLNLSFSETNIFHSTFDRPNLHFSVRSAENRIDQIVNFIKKRPSESGIVYCLSRKSTEYVAEKISDKNITARAYHAGMDDQLRDERQKKFVYDEIDVVCATVAFGMGIDKSNIRWVVHYNLPKNIESYYQQIGRAGRDGSDSRAILFYNPADFGKLRNFAKQSGQTQLQMAKLKHMRHFAEAENCRRKILLNYFGEKFQDTCNNCDNCQKDITRFEASDDAYKVLSVLARSPKHLEKRTLVDILLGKKTMKIQQDKLDKIKTFGLGSEKPSKLWRDYTKQLINLGLIRFSYDNYKKLALTKKGKKYLNQLKTIKLTPPKDRQEEYLEVDTDIQPKNQKSGLYKKLSMLRKKLSQKKEVAPYIIFNDKTLEELVETKPVAKHTLLRISGIGKKKLERYGAEIMKTIQNYVISCKEDKKISQEKIIFSLYKKDKPVVDIAKKLDTEKGVVYQKLQKLLENGYNINIKDFLSSRKIQQIKQAVQATDRKTRAKRIKDKLDFQIDRAKLGFILADINFSKQSKTVVYV